MHRLGERVILRLVCTRFQPGAKMQPDFDDDLDEMGVIGRRRLDLRAGGLEPIQKVKR
jgi:hypothetical protein